MNDRLLPPAVRPNCINCTCDDAVYFTVKDHDGTWSNWRPMSIHDWNGYLPKLYCRPLKVDAHIEFDVKISDIGESLAELQREFEMINNVLRNPTKVESYRSSGLVNTDYDMVRVTIDMPKRQWDCWKTKLK